jgi:hypothetical protein
MDNSQFNKERSEKELLTELLRIIDGFVEVECENMQFEQAMTSAENLGLKGQMHVARLKMMFIKQKSFYLNLRFSRIFNLLLQKNKDYTSN